MATAVLLAQTEARFDVVSIKPAEQLTAAGMALPGFHRGLRMDPGRVDIRFMPLRQLITTAYGVTPSRMVGPGWLMRPELGGARIFDIQAKMPAGSSKTQVPEMLRGMLADRFRLVVHRESRQTEVMALVVSANGPKLQPATGDASPIAAPAGRKASQDYDTGLNDGHLQVFPAGKSEIAIHSSPDGVSKVTTENLPGGMSHYEVSGVTMDWLAKSLDGLGGMPVINATGITGRYNAVYDFPRVGTAPAERMAGVQTGLAKLGLKLDKRKASVEFLVVDHVEKDPAAN